MNRTYRRSYLEAYIRSLPDGALDRIIEAQEWVAGSWHGGSGTAGCLVAHAEGRNSEFNREASDIRRRNFPNVMRMFDDDVENRPGREVRSLSLFALGAVTRTDMKDRVCRVPLKHPTIRFVKRVAGEELERRHRARVLLVEATETAPT